MEFGVIVILQKINFWDVISLIGLDKIFSFIERFQPSSGNLGFIFCDFCKKKIFGDVNLWGLKKMFSFIEKLFSKIYSHFPISIIFGEFGVIYCDFCKQ